MKFNSVTEVEWLVVDKSYTVTEVEWLVVNEI